MIMSLRDQSARDSTVCFIYSSSRAEQQRRALAVGDTAVYFWNAVMSMLWRSPSQVVPLNIMLLGQSSIAVSSLTMARPYSYSKQSRAVSDTADESLGFSGWSP